LSAERPNSAMRYARIVSSFSSRFLCSNRSLVISGSQESAASSHGKTVGAAVWQCLCCRGDERLLAHEHLTVRQLRYAYRSRRAEH
jgi:hypothetical protein